MAKLELQAAMSEIEDPQVAEAVNTLVFNLHHDRGLPMVPSSYDEKQLKPVTKALRLMWGVSGQDTRFDNPGPTFKSAYSWLDGFWKERREQETSIVGR